MENKKVRLKTTGLSRNNRILLIVLLVVILLACIGQYVLRPDRSAELSIVYTGGIQGEITYTQGTNAGYEKIAAVASKAGKKSDKVILLDMGDCLGCNEFSEIDEGSSIISLMDTTDYSAMVPGTMDYVYGLDTLSSLRAQAAFPFLACNLVKADGSEAFESYRTININSVRVGIIGVTTGITQTQAEKDSLVIEDPVTSVQNVLDEIKGKTDANIIMVYSGDSEMVSELAALEDVSIVIQGGVSESSVSDASQESAMIVSAGTGGGTVGVATITVKKDKVTIENSFCNASDYDSLTSDSEVAAAVTAAISDHNSLSAQTLGTLNVPESDSSEDETQNSGDVSDDTSDDTSEETETASGNACETATGDIVTDAMLDATAADGSVIALIPDADIHGYLPNGNVSDSMVYNLFDDNLYVVTCEMTGGDIRSFLEDSFNGYPQASGFLQESGLTYTFDSSTSIGSTISDLYVQGSTLDDARTYVVTMTSDIAQQLGITTESAGMLNIYHSVSYIVSNYISACLEEDAKRDQDDENFVSSLYDEEQTRITIQ